MDTVSLTPMIQPLLFNLTLALPDFFSSACREVFPSIPETDRDSFSKKYVLQITGKKPGTDILNSRKTLSLASCDGMGKLLPYGLLLRNKKTFVLHLSHTVPMHLPFFLCFLLMEIIKRFGQEHGLFLLHSACIYQGESACLIPGKQGQGKTTLSKKISGTAILNDDLTLVAYHKKNNEFYAFKIPTPEDLHSHHPFLWQGPVKIKKILFPSRIRPYGIFTLDPIDTLDTLKTEEIMISGSRQKKEGNQEKIQFLLKKMTAMIPASRICYDAREDLSWLHKALV
jgi:hypothetical protein